ncbi:MAG: 2'-5' RNA ligase family protein [Bowdeniella nasicola]|nr:2'-5' RNA ligase family protein [Bowdeniella nasicola]
MTGQVTDADSELKPYVCVIVPLSGRLARTIREVRARSLPAGHDVPPHLTVLPPTPLAGESLDDIVSAADRLAARTPPFRLGCAGVGTFTPVSPVDYLRISRGSARIHALHEALTKGLRDAVFRFPFVPHVTLVQSEDDDLRSSIRERMAHFVGECTIRKLCVVVGSLPDRWQIHHCADLTAANRAPASV